jgi:hypothetical protein
VKEQDLINISKNVMRHVHDELGHLDAQWEDTIKKCIIYELRNWVYVSVRESKRKKESPSNYSRKTKEQIDIQKQIAFNMLDNGCTNADIEKDLNLSGFTMWNYKKEWMALQNTKDIKSKAWYEQEYPGLHPAMYEALAAGKVKEDIIRRNRW